MANQQLLTGLNEQLNRKVKTFLRYMVQAASIKGAEWQVVRDMYKVEVVEEVAHGQYLADQLAMLGGSVKLQPDLSPPLTDVWQMLKADSREEDTDVRNYVALAGLAEQAGLVALKLMQAADEDWHSQEMQRLLG